MAHSGLHETIGNRASSPIANESWITTPPAEQPFVFINDDDKSEKKTIAAFKLVRIVLIEPEAEQRKALRLPLVSPQVSIEIHVFLYNNKKK
jgi:hypothetical protein